jgi:hypothetical protein
MAHLSSHERNWTRSPYVNLRQQAQKFLEAGRADCGRYRNMKMAGVAVTCFRHAGGRQVFLH